MVLAFVRVWPVTKLAPGLLPVLAVLPRSLDRKSARRQVTNVAKTELVSAVCSSASRVCRGPGAISNRAALAQRAKAQPRCAGSPGAEGGDSTAWVAGMLSCRVESCHKFQLFHARCSSSDGMILPGFRT